MFLKKIFSSILISIFTINLIGIFSENIFAETKERIFDKSVPEITKIETVYSNKKGDFFIYGKNFGKDPALIKIMLKPDGVGQDDQEIKFEKIFPTMISGKISGNYKNGNVMIVKTIGEKETVSSNLKFFDFGLPVLKKVNAPNGILGGKKIIFTGENFKKPIYGILGKEKIICEKDDDKTCEVTIPKDSNFNGKIGIESYGFERLIDDAVGIEKTANVEVSSYSNNLINFKVDGFEFKDLRTAIKSEKDRDLKETDLKSGVDIFLDGQKLSDCKVNISNRISCKIDKEIFKKGIGYVDFFGIKTPFFAYDLSKSTPYPTSFKKSVKWSTYQDPTTKQTKEGNRIYLEIGIANFDYQKSSEKGFGQSTKKDFKLIFGGKEYSPDDSNVTLSKDKIELVLSSMPSKMKGEIYFKLGNVKSESIAYDFGEYIPELYKVYKTEKENVFAVEGKNLTNFSDLEASLKFGDISLSTNIINKIILEKTREAEKNKKKYEDFLNDAQKKIKEEEAKEGGGDQDVIDNYEQKIPDYKKQILKYEGILKDLANGIYEKTNVDNEKEEGEILKKSDTRITFKVFDPDEYGKPIGKGEYKVSVTSNGKTTNVLDFFYDPASSQNSEKAYPVIDKIDFPNGAGNPSVIEFKGYFLDRIKEIYFTDLKGKIVKKEKNKLLVNVDPEAVLRKRGTIIAKLDDFTMTSNLFFYDFIKDKTNKVSLNWKKIEKNKDGEVESPEKDGKITFELLLKNTYKNLIFDNLKIKIENLDKKSLPFYDFYLDSPTGKIKGVYDKKKSTINFKNIDFSKNIEFDEDKFYKFNLVFEKNKSGKGEIKISPIELNFYDDFNFPKKISKSKISLTKNPKFYKIEDKDLKFCKELNTKMEFVDCGTEIGFGEDLEENSVFKEEVIKSDFKAPKRKSDKIANFVDVDKNQWFAPYVENLYQRGVIQGYGFKSKVFKPLATITRAEAVKILLVARNEDLSGLNYKVFAFQDVPEGHWAKNILEFAVRNKFLTPVKNFHLDKKITRGEAAKLITRFFGRTVPEYSKYSLSDLGTHWSSNNAEYLFQNGIISGVGDTKEFKPDNKVTRSEFAKMISLAIDVWSR